MEEFYKLNIDKNQAREMFSLMHARSENHKNKKALAYVQGMKDTLKVLGIDEDKLEDFMHGEGVSLIIKD